MCVEDSDLEIDRASGKTIMITAVVFFWVRGHEMYDVGINELGARVSRINS